MSGRNALKENVDIVARGEGKAKLLQLDKHCVFGPGCVLLRISIKQNRSWIGRYCRCSGH